MAIKLIANYSKRLGLPGYSSHQFSIEIETELVTTDDVPTEAARIYELLQSNVDDQIRATGFVPPSDYGMEGAASPDPSGKGEHGSRRAPSSTAWKCSQKQRELIESLVAEHQLDKGAVESLAVEKIREGSPPSQQGGGLRIDRRTYRYPRRPTAAHQRLAALGVCRSQRERRSPMIALADLPARSSTTLPDYISPSAAKSYLSCSLRFYFERVIQLKRRTTPALHLGKAVHAALQAFHLARWRGSDDSPEVIAGAFEDSFLKLEREEGPVKWKEGEREKCRLAGLRVVAAYLDSSDVPNEKPRAVEVLLTETVTGLQVPLTGTIDLVTDIFAPVDFKSAAAKPDAAHAAFDHELQLVAYQLLLEQATGERPPSLDLVYLVKTKVPQVIRISSPPADRRRKDRVLRMIDSAVTGMAEGRFHPQPGMACMSCQYRNECKAWPGVMERRAA
jgi:putative RecB family exonuclease